MSTIETSGKPEKMTRIDRLMRDLEACAAGPGIKFPGNVEAMASDARQLILDLLRMSELPVGETIAQAADKRIAAAHEDDSGPHDVTTMIAFARQWLPEVYPASEDGKVHFFRAIVESLCHSAEITVKRMDAIDQYLADVVVRANVDLLDIRKRLAKIRDDIHRGGTDA